MYADMIPNKSLYKPYDMTTKPHVYTDTSQD